MKCQVNDTDRIKTVPTALRLIVIKRRSMRRKLSVEFAESLLTFCFDIHIRCHLALIILSLLQEVGTPVTLRICSWPTGLAIA